MECCPLILDRRSIIIVALAVAVLIGFSVYTLGSYSAPPKAGTKVQPASTADIKNNTQQQTLISKSEITTKMSVVLGLIVSIISFVSLAFFFSAIVAKSKITAKTKLRHLRL
jgi:Ca2+/Na+ antiporter